MKLVKEGNEYITLDQQDNDEGGELVTVFEKGKMVKEYTLEEVRNKVGCV